MIYITLIVIFSNRKDRAIALVNSSIFVLKQGKILLYDWDFQIAKILHLLNCLKDEMQFMSGSDTKLIQSITFSLTFFLNIAVRFPSISIQIPTHFKSI